MAIINKDESSLSNSNVKPPDEVDVGDLISSNTFDQMLKVLSDLSDHTHTIYDDYTAVCVCACACGRGIL